MQGINVVLCDGVRGRKLHGISHTNDIPDPIVAARITRIGGRGDIIKDHFVFRPDKYAVSVVRVGHNNSRHGNVAIVCDVISIGDDLPN